jgi:hypothetical protein
MDAIRFLGFNFFCNAKDLVLSVEVDLDWDDVATLTVLVSRSLQNFQTTTSNINLRAVSSKGLSDLYAFSECKYMRSIYIHTMSPIPVPPPVTTAVRPLRL